MDESRYLTTLSLSRFIKRAKGTLEIMRSMGTGPKYIKLGNSRTSRILYDIRDVEEWLENHKIKPGSINRGSKKERPSEQ